MRRAAILGLMTAVAMTSVVGCGASKATTPPAAAPIAKDPGASAPVASDDGPKAVEPADAMKNGNWIGASAESEMILSGTTETFVGVWVDVPNVHITNKPPVDLALVVDTSGSMAGAKIVNARAAAKQLIESMQDGDIVSIDTFSDRAETFVAPTVLTPDSRDRLLAAVARLRPQGSTNLFDGLSLAEAHVAQAPGTHTVRRVVVISDGIANVGPSTPEALGAVAERGLRFRAQVTSLGVGNDYDENTLNALAVKSSGRLFHVSDPVEMTAFLKKEVDLLTSTVASDAFVEVMPAPGVRLVGTDGIRTDWQSSGALRIPLGALYSGQHREALVKVRVDPSRFEGAAQKPLASVRLVFHDPNDGDLERIQETVARVSQTSDGNAVASHASARTQAIVAVQDAAKLKMQAAQAMNQGQFVDADKELAAAERKVVAQAAITKDDTQKKRLDATAASIQATRRAAGAAAAAPKAVQRDEALKANKSGMGDLGY
jgi:Ca-activated chloride channel family protein